MNGGAARWTEGVGTVSLGPLSGAPLGIGGTSAGVALNNDGSVIVGGAIVRISTSPTGIPIEEFRGFRWTQRADAVMLPSNPAFNNASATDISFVGSVIVGVSYGGNPSINPRFWRFTDATGYQFFEPAGPVSGPCKPRSRATARRSSSAG